MSFEDELQRAARTPSIDGVMDRVSGRHSRRRRNHRVAVGAAATMTLAVATTAAMVVTRNDEIRTVKIAGPTTTAAVKKTLVEMPRAHTAVPTGFTSADGTWITQDKDLTLESLVPPDGFSSVHAPAISDGRDGIWVVGTRGPEGGHPTLESIVHVDSKHAVTSIVDFNGTVESMATADGTVYVVVAESHGNSKHSLQFKRITNISSTSAPTTTSVALPDGSVLAGEIVIHKGSVWIPVEKGVLRFGARSGDAPENVVLPKAATRVLVRGPKGIWSSDGTDMVLIDPTTFKVTERAPIGAEVVGAGGYEGTMEGGPANDLAVRRPSGRFAVWPWDPGYMDDGATVPASPLTPNPGRGPMDQDRLIGDAVHIASASDGTPGICSLTGTEQRCAFNDREVPVLMLRLSGLSEVAWAFPIPMVEGDPVPGYPVVAATSHAVWYVKLHTMGVY